MRHIFDTKASRFLATIVVLAVGISIVVISLISAGTKNSIWCAARVSTTRPLSYHIVTIYVTTKPNAKVSGTVTSGGLTLSMIPTAPADASGKALFYQKISAVTESIVQHVTVRVSLDGLVGHCYTEYAPVVLSAP